MFKTKKSKRILIPFNDGIISQYNIYRVASRNKQQGRPEHRQATTRPSDIFNIAWARAYAKDT